MISKLSTCQVSLVIEIYGKLMLQIHLPTIKSVESFSLSIVQIKCDLMSPEANSKLSFKTNKYHIIFHICFILIKLILKIQCLFKMSRKFWDWKIFKENIKFVRVVDSLVKELKLDFNGLLNKLKEILKALDDRG